MLDMFSSLIEYSAPPSFQYASLQLYLQCTESYQTYMIIVIIIAHWRKGLWRIANETGDEEHIYQYTEVSG